ncbi:uncharacterized protein LOC107263876 [Cephus cinctus]|uniref:Uncharacterized protein LOC107263876 n=1 Tax=Cephus cinctus TaxID=211228 RepID=A0AAJ7BIQ2_CEPCN|nr:uncharacterized protein LOC107263876 [Cephus cinctus]
MAYPPCVITIRKFTDVSSSNSRRKSQEFLLLCIAIMASTCSWAQDVNTNTVSPGNVSPATSIKDSDSVRSRELICPVGQQLGRLAQLFAIPCNRHGDCAILGPDERCCGSLCRKGIPAPPKEPPHEAVLGIDRMCPKEPVPETLPIQRCKTDRDCGNSRRICCPDQKDLQLYCRTAAPVWAQLPFQQTHATLMSLLAYMQCQAPPPATLDLFPQACNRTTDCFPNLCCQEGNGKYCRAPKKSLAALVAQATQRFARG